MENYRILFVCLGNICRSPIGEGIFAHIAAEAGLEGSIFVDSAGTGGWHVGNPPDPRARTAAAARGISISHQRARQVTREDFSDFDLILAMDRDNLETLRRLAGGDPGERVKLLLDYAPEAGLRDVPDPYYGGPQGFEEVLDLIETASRGLLADLTGGAKPAQRPESG
ncbi:MAG: low molecular weight phosphotyrosine protein phosphatase [Hyphomicrobiales bacterium]|nr:low molecular weight phosphotyrosine protein phosphatase [Hyphomicrobiales bacterium]